MDAPENTPRRFSSEALKLLPVIFVVANICILYTIFTIYHLLPLLYHHHAQGLTQTIIFNVLVALLLICYVLCVCVHPGTIPDNLQEVTWEYAPETGMALPASVREMKRCGDRRHCKWCAKYKPDRCHHCRACRVCILRMDHHCPWIYNCVGFQNHKYFFLLLVYAALACHFVIWAMVPTLRIASRSTTEFSSMFLVLFGSTLACFLGFPVTIFLCFHMWLMTKAMTTIEFCEKSLKKSDYDSHIYDRGLYGNIQAVLGDNPLLWLLPVNLPTGDGVTFITDETPLHKAVYQDPHLQHLMSQEWNPARKKSRRGTSAGTGSAPSPDSSIDSSEDSDASEPLLRDFRLGTIDEGQQQHPPRWPRVD